MILLRPTVWLHASPPWEIQCYENVSDQLFIRVPTAGYDVSAYEFLS